MLTFHGGLSRRQVCRMACRLRVQFSEAICHVMNRGDRREAIFQDDPDRQRFLQTPDPGKDAFHRVPDIPSGRPRKFRDGVKSVPTLVHGEESTEKKAERLMWEGLKKAGWTEEDPRMGRKSEPAKLELAEQLVSGPGIECTSQKES